MKKIVLIVLIGVVLAGLANLPIIEAETQQAEQDYARLILGTWVTYTATLGEKGEKQSLELRYEFREDGTLRFTLVDNSQFPTIEKIEIEVQYMIRGDLLISYLPLTVIRWGISRILFIDHKKMLTVDLIDHSTAGVKDEVDFNFEKILEQKEIPPIGAITTFEKRI
jgi:hypothetical protein